MAAPLHLEARGAPDAPALLLIHGWGMNLRVFDALADALARDHHVLAVDLPGHGRSPWHRDHELFAAQADAIAATLDGAVAPGTPCALVGWSLGGQYALELAHRAAHGSARPVPALVLLASTPRFTTAAGWDAGLAPAMLETFSAQLARDWHATLEEFLALQVRGGREAATVLEALHEALRAHGEPRPVALAAGLAHLHDQDLRPRAAGIPAPTLLIAGQHDRVTPPAASRWLAAQLRAAQVLEIPRAGHAPFLSHPAEVQAAIAGFLA